jgi:hypothetical protein
VHAAGEGPSAPATQLLVLAHGVPAEALTSGLVLPVAAAARRHGAVVPLDQVDDRDDPGAALSAALPARELRDLSIRVDRKSLVLRPPWRSDDQVVDQIGERPTGPAAVTVLELFGPLRAAIAGGLGHAHREALEQLDHHVARACEQLRRGDPPALWLVALGGPVPARTTLDVARCVRDHLPWLAGGFTIEVAPHAATVRAQTRRGLDLLLARLGDTPLAALPVHDRGDGAVRFLAPPELAFGPRPVFARAAHRGERPAAALVPRPLRQTGRLDLRSLAARVAMAAVAAAWAHAADDADARAPSPARDDAVPAGDLAPVSDAP